MHTRETQQQQPLDDRYRLLPAGEELSNTMGQALNLRGWGGFFEWRRLTVREAAACRWREAAGEGAALLDTPADALWWSDGWAEVGHA
jgi:hypothetical protein